MIAATNGNNPQDQRASTGIQGRKHYRRVFPNHMVAHVWAQQTQEEGRSLNGNLYFVGSTIFSYGSHFPVARFTDGTLEGQRVVLMNCETYNNTTAKHKSRARGALRGLSVIVLDVPFVTEHGRFGYARPKEMHQGNLDYFAKRFQDHAEAMANPRRKVWLRWDSDARIEDTPDARIASLDEYVLDIHHYADAFNLTRPHVDLDGKVRAIRDAFAKFNDPVAVAKRAKAAVKRANKRLAAGHAIIARAYAYIEGAAPRLPFGGESELERLPVDRSLIDAYRATRRRNPEFIREQNRWKRQPEVTPDQWRSGEGNISALSSGWNEPTYLRKVGDFLETSRSVDVPWPHAVRAFFKAQECRRASVEWHRNGDKCPVGHFQVDRIEADGTLHAGCHTLTWDEMLRLAVREMPERVPATFPVPALIVS